MSSTGGYPSSLTQITPHGPCTLTLTCCYPEDRAILPKTLEGANSDARVELACPQLRIGEAMYTAYVLADVNHADLRLYEMSVHIRRPASAGQRGPVPNEHQELWRQLARTVLSQLLTRENFELLRRADAHRALQTARRDVDVLATALARANESVRFYEILNTVLDLTSPRERDIGLRLARTWHGTADELVTCLSALSDRGPELSQEWRRLYAQRTQAESVFGSGDGDKSSH